ncbi:MAG: hypothetical protein QF535_17660 [Anaerolineales bacterium]|jgi:hypothetical protein|nr:hypothetical protein [Anaerolineales bacterium]
MTITNLAAISAGTAIVVDVNLIHDATVTDTVTITTQFSPTSGGTFSVDTGTADVTANNLATDTAYLRYDLSNVFRVPVERSNSIITRTGRAG